MFTRDDQTVEDCLEVFEAIRDVGLTHLGFKDVGVEARAPRLADATAEVDRRMREVLARVKTPAAPERRQP